MLNNADSFILNGPLASRGYDSWWHSFTGKDAETGEERSFFIEFYFCNPELGSDKVILGQPRKHKKGVKPLPVKPSYLMVKAGCWGEGGVQLHRFFPWSKVEINEGRFFYFSAGDCFVSRDATCGRVKVIEDEEVVMEFNTNVTPCLVKPEEGSDFEFLILPVRITS